MPYATIADLPATVRLRLPNHALHIWRAAYNAAWASHRDDPRREEIAPRIAWTAVKHRYQRVGTEWLPRGRQVGRARSDSNARA